MALKADEVEYEVEFILLKQERGLELSRGEQNTLAFYYHAGGCASCHAINKKTRKEEEK